MKKLILCILCLLVCSVCAAAEPAKKVVFWYQVPEVILEVQNPENDTEKGKVEFEASSRKNMANALISKSSSALPKKS